MLNINEVIFTSYCFGTAYLKQQERLRESILSIYPEANLHFLNEPEETGKPKFQQSLYGFKVGLVKDCLLKGFKKIIFFDTAVTLNNKVDYWFDVLPYHGVLSAKDNQKLNNVTSNDCLKYNGLTRDQVSEWNLCGGSIYVFDFDLELCNSIFNHWGIMESNGIFGKQDDLSHDRLQSHRMDETCMAIALQLCGRAPVGHDVMKYGYIRPGNGELTSPVPLNEIIALKIHFK